MKLEGERKLPGRPERVWEMLLDPDVLVSAIPGCEKLERVAEDHYTGVISAKVGSIQSTYNATFKIGEKDPPNSYLLNMQGQGSAGFVKGDVRMHLEPAEDNMTLLRFSGDANVGGRIAQVGQRMVRATATAMIDQGFEDLRERVEQEVAADDTADASERAAGAAAAEEQKKGLGARLQRFFRFIRTFFRALFRGSTSDKKS